MAFAGNCGIKVNLSSKNIGIFEVLFAEELGLVLEVSENRVQYIWIVIFFLSFE